MVVVARFLLGGLLPPGRRLCIPVRTPASLNSSALSHSHATKHVRMHFTR